MDSIGRFWLQILVLCFLQNTSIAENEFACGRTRVNENRDYEWLQYESPLPMPKSNLELSLEPLQISVDWFYNHLQPRDDIFTSVIHNVTSSVNDVINDPTGITSRRVVHYYAGYTAIAVLLALIAVFWPLVGFCWCCCRCCCHNCCYSRKGDEIYGQSSKKGGCRRCGCGFLFFLLLLVVIGACLGCFISAVVFRFNTTSSANLEAASEAVQSAYNKRPDAVVSSSQVAYPVITERIGASALDFIDQLRALGHIYAGILKRHVTDLTESMMDGVKDIVERLSHYIDSDWLGGANATLEATKKLQENITLLSQDLATLSEEHNTVQTSAETCSFTAQALKADILDSCSETITRECSRELMQHLTILELPNELLDILKDLPTIDSEKIEKLKQQNIGDQAEQLLSVYTADLRKIQNEANQVASGSTVRASVLKTLNNSLGQAAEVLIERTDAFAEIARNRVVSTLCSTGATDAPLVAEYAQPAMNYSFYALMGIAGLIGVLVVFIGFSILTCCAGKPHYKRASCLAVTAITVTFLSATILAVAALILFTTTAMVHTEMCRPIERQDAAMFRLLDDMITEQLATGNFENESGEWPPELIFTSSKR